MVTKGILAASIGAGVRGWIQEHIPPKIIRYAGVARAAAAGNSFGDRDADGRSRLTAADRKAAAPPLGFIVCLGIVSLFADMTYEGAHSASSARYLQNLGASAAEVAFIAGLGEMLGASLRFFSGRLADRTHAYWTITLSATR